MLLPSLAERAYDHHERSSRCDFEEMNKKKKSCNIHFSSSFRFEIANFLTRSNSIHRDLILPHSLLLFRPVAAAVHHNSLLHFSPHHTESVRENDCDQTARERERNEEKKYRERFSHGPTTRHSTQQTLNTIHNHTDERDGAKEKNTQTAAKPKTTARTTAPPNEINNNEPNHQAGELAGALRVKLTVICVY